MKIKYKVYKSYGSEFGGKVVYVGFDKRVNKHAFVLSIMKQDDNLSLDSLFYEGGDDTNDQDLGKIEEIFQWK